MSWLANTTNTVLRETLRLQKSTSSSKLGPRRSKTITLWLSSEHTEIDSTKAATTNFSLKAVYTAYAATISIDESITV